MDNIIMKRGDTLPALRYALDPATVDLTGAAVTALMRLRNGASVPLAGATSVVIATGTPTVEYAWTEADTAVAGLYEFEFEVIFPGGGRMTFPRAGFIQVQMIQDIEAVAPAAPPVNTALPVIAGTPIVGQTLTASAGVWMGAPTGYAFQWQRNGAAIAGATASSYPLVSADIGAAIRVQVTATNAAGNAAAISAATAAVLPLAPVNSELPTISGAAQVGQTLTISAGAWANGPTSFAAVLSNGATPAGTGPWTYVVPEAALGLTLAVTVTATNAGGVSAPATSAATSAVIAATVPAPVNTALPTITGTARVGQTLTGTEGAWTGAPTITLQWLRGTTAISGATGLTYAPVTDDVGATLSLRATATNAGGSVAATSAATAAVAAGGPTLATLPVTPTVRYHPGFSTVVETAGRVDSASDLMGLAQATKPTSGTGPRALTDALGRKYWQFNGLANEYLNVATTLTGQNNRAITVFAVCRIFHTGNIYQIGSADFGTTLSTGGPSLGIGAAGNGDAPCVVSHGRLGNLATTNREYMVSGTQLQVLGGRSNTTANGFTQLFINKRMGQRDQNSVAGSGGIGGEIGKSARLELYELVIYNRTVTNAEAQSIADALTDHYAIPEVTNYLVCEGDSRWAGTITTNASTVWSAIITTPGAGYLDGSWRVQNFATSGNRVANIVARRDNANGWGMAKLPGRNIVAYEIGANDVGGGGFTEQQWYDAMIPMLNTPTTGILQRGWEVVVGGNYTPISSLHFNRYENPAFAVDTQTGPGATFDGKLKLARLPRIEIGGVRVLDVPGTASDPYMQADNLHPEAGAHLLFITGGDTPQNGLLATIAP